ncbi:MAG: SH3 domain protein [Gammaproteobacteria bacterium]|jgi:SH3 domain protein
MNTSVRVPRSLRVRIALATICVVASTNAGAAYVVDRLLVGLHENHAPDSPVVKVVPTGSELQVLEIFESYSRVRTAEGAVGWVNSSYVTEDKPGWLQVSEFQAVSADKTARLATALSTIERLQKRLGERLDAAPARDATAQGGGPDIEHLRDELALVREQMRLLKEDAVLREMASRKDAETEIKALHGQLEAVRHAGGTGTLSSTDLRELQSLAEENKRLKSALEQVRRKTELAVEAPPASEWTVDAVAWRITRAGLWELIVLALTTLLAFFLGAFWIDSSSRRRLGGFRF